MNYSNAPTLRLKDKGSIGIRSYDYGPTAALAYNFHKKLAVEAGYYYGSEISYKQTTNVYLRIQQATLGLRYTFYNSGKVKD